MKASHLFILLFFVNLLTVNVKASKIQNNITPDDIIDDIAMIIKSGNANKLATFFSSTIDLLVPNNEGTYSKTQAELIFKDFFSKYPPRSFSISQKGASGEGSKFAIGNYTSTQGTSFRVYFLLKKISNNYLITLIEFDSE